MQDSEVLADFRRQVIERTKFVNLAGVPLPRDREGQPRNLELPIDEIYIRVLAIREEERISREEEEIKRFREEQYGEMESRERCGEISPSLGKHLYDRTQESPASEKISPIDPEDALKKHKRIAVLGAPGAGKSTMLRYMAYKAALDPKAPLPMLVILRDYAAYLDSGGSGSLRDFALRESSGGNQALLQALEEISSSGSLSSARSPILWLVDGLDEAREHRDNVAKGISQLSGDLVLTSRPYGYHRTDLTSLAHFAIEPLTIEDVDSFIKKWFAALSKQGRSEPGSAEENISWLKGQLDKLPQIRMLTKNPLLLTFLMVLAGKDPKSDLPSSKSKLYKKYIEELLDFWEAHRRSSSKVVSLGDLQEQNARDAALEGLYHIGWYLHLSYFGGEGGPSPTRESLTKKLCDVKWLEKKWGLKEGSAEVAAREIIDFWIKTGILNTWPIMGTEYLAFRHMTFQEYAASWALAEGWKKDDGFTWKFLRPRLHHYAWREPIILIGGMIEKEELGKLLRRMLRGPSRYERELHRDLFLAGTVISEISPGDTLREEIIRRLVKLIVSRKTRIRDLTSHPKEQALLNLPLRIKSYISDTDEAFSILGNLGEAAVPHLLSLLGNDDSSVRWSAAGALINIGESAEANLLPLLKSDDWRVRESAAEVLGNIGKTSVIPDLLLLIDDGDWRVRKSVAEALGNIGEASAVPSLLFLSKDKSSFVRGIAVEALGKLGESTIQHLLPLIEDKNWYIRASVTEAFGNMGASAIPYLLPFLKFDNLQVRGRAAESLGKIGEASVVPRLLPLLKDDDWSVRRRTVEALGNIGEASAVPDILPLFKDSNPPVQWAAALALENIGKAAVPHLLPLLEYDNSWVRARAAEALGIIGEISVVLDLLPLLKDDNSWVRECTVEALGNLCEASIVRYLLPLLKDEDNSVRMCTTTALGKIGDTSAIQHHLLLLKDDDSRIRIHAAVAVGMMHETSAVPHLLPLLDDNDSLVRFYVIEALGKILYNLDETREVKRIARELWWRLTDAENVTRAALSALLQAANRLTVLEVKGLKVVDPLYPPIPKKGILRRIIAELKSIANYILLLISMVIAGIITKLAEGYLKGESINVFFVALLVIIFLVALLLKKWLDRP